MTTSDHLTQSDLAHLSEIARDPKRVTVQREYGDLNDARDFFLGLCSAVALTTIGVLLGFAVFGAM